MKDSVSNSTNITPFYQDIYSKIEQIIGLSNFHRKAVKKWVENDQFRFSTHLLTNFP